MNVYEITNKVLERELNEEAIPEEFVIVAKHQVLGLESQQIADTLGVEVADITAICELDLYKRIRTFIGGVAAQNVTTQSSGWDAIEQTAIERLVKKLPSENDKEFLLRVAAVANKAQRRVAPKDNVLDPSARAGRTMLVLSQRLVNKINRDGGRVTEEERRISISDGSMTNPTFEEVDALFQIKNSPILSHAVEISTRNADPTDAELLEAFMNS